jgi:hypothetical protein
MMMDLIDNANAWEQTHCRISAGSGAESNATLSDILTCPLPSFGDHQTLADRSIGHAVGPLALLFLAGYDARSEAYKNVELFFRHYLIARQLHDDAHDWTDDLLRGRVNSIGAIVLDDFRKEYSGGEKTMTVAAALPKLKKIFWEETIDTAVCMILSHTASARRARENSPLGETDFAESMLQRLESGARRAIVERDKAVIFLKDYKDSRTPGA